MLRGANLGAFRTTAAAVDPGGGPVPGERRHSDRERPARPARRRVAQLLRRDARDEVLAARADRQGQRQGSAGRLAVDLGRSGAAALESRLARRPQRGNAADGQRRRSTRSPAWGWSPRSIRRPARRAGSTTRRATRPACRTTAGFVQRGLAYWTDGTRERAARRHARMRICCRSMREPASPIPRSASGGKVDLTIGIRDAVRATNFTARRPLVAGDVVVVGNSISGPGDGQRKAPPGYVHAFDVRTGKRLWTFHTIPKPGEFGYDTWLDNSAEYTGSANVWGGGVYDPELDYVYLADVDADQQLLRRPSAREQPVRREPRLPRGEDRQARVALPGGAPRHLGLRLPDPSDPRRHHRRRPAHQGGHPGQQAGIHLRLRSQDGRAGLADRGAAGAGRRRVPGERYVADAAVSDQAARLRSAGRRPKRTSSTSRRS